MAAHKKEMANHLFHFVMDLNSLRFFRLCGSFLNRRSFVSRFSRFSRSRLRSFVSNLGFRNFNRVEYLPVNVSRLDAKFEAGDVVDGESLKAKGIIKHADALVKVLGDGEITKALTVRVDKVSASAKAKIEAAGGKVEEPC